MNSIISVIGFVLVYSILICLATMALPSTFGMATKPALLARYTSAPGPPLTPTLPSLVRYVTECVLKIAPTGFKSNRSHMTIAALLSGLLLAGFGAKAAILW